MSKRDRFLRQFGGSLIGAQRLNRPVFGHHKANRNKIRGVWIPG
uniref:Uncharacterized protein n=1 Tax=Anguilla anguilla TaxID=7936 RepID=A0A0E9QRT8_ANGAN